MLKKITDVIITMSMLFSMFVTTPVYAATKKVATGLKEISAITFIPNNKTNLVADESVDAWNKVYEKFGSNGSICVSSSNKFASVITDDGRPAIYNLKTKTSLY